MSRHTRYELRRKCAKCNITASENNNVLSFHRFPLPGKRTFIKARVWAKYCYPTEDWSTEKSLRDLHLQHKMLCSKHFDESSFTSSARIRLNNYAIPIGAQDLLIKFRQEQCASSSETEQNTSISVEEPQSLETRETSLPVQVTQIPPPPPPPPNQTKKRQTPRGHCGRRIAAAASTPPEKEQPGTGDVKSERVSSTRARLDETRSPREEAKRAKTDAKQRRAVSYANASQSHLRVAVITVPPRDLSQGQAEQLREAIDDSILQAVLSPSSQSVQAPSFRGRPFLLDGVLAMWCEDANALSWLEKAVKAITSPIPNTTLAVIKQSELKKRLKAGLLVHTRITDAATLQRVLCAQNPWYKVDSWQCYDMTVDDKQKEESSKEKAVHLILGIPEDQKQAILDRDRRVSHMSGSSYIRFFSAEEAASGKNQTAMSDSVKESQPSMSAPQKGQSETETNSSREMGGGTSEEDDVLCTYVVSRWCP